MKKIKIFFVMVFSIILVWGGTATSVSAANGLEYQYTDRVERYRGRTPKKVDINKNMTLRVGQTAKIKMKNYKGDAEWLIDQRREVIKSIKTRPNYITFLCLNSGTAKVMRVIDGQTYTCKVTVTENGKKLGKKEEEQTAILGNSVYLEYAPGNMEESVVDDIQPVNKLPKDWKVTWKSSMPSVVAPSGQVYRNHRNNKVIMTAVLKKGRKTYRIRYLINVVAVRDFRPEDIEDLSIEDITRMNKKDLDYYYEFNDYGCLDVIFGKYSTVRVDSYESALYSLYSVRTLLGLTNPLVELVPYYAETDSGGQTYRFTQMIDGIECFDNIIIVACDCDGLATYLASSYFPVTGTVDTTPSYSYEQCRELLSQEFPGATITKRKSPRMFMINCDGQWEPAWEMYLHLQKPSGEYGTGIYQVLVGARDGKRKYMELE